MVYLITYDLNKPGKDYTSLYLALRQYQFIRDVGLDSVWFVSTSWTAGQIYEHLRLHLDISDRLFIAQIRRGEYYGWMNKDIWVWIDKYFRP